MPGNLAHGPEDRAIYNIAGLQLFPNHTLPELWEVGLPPEPFQYSQAECERNKGLHFRRFP